MTARVPVHRFAADHSQGAADHSQGAANALEASAEHQGEADRLLGAADLLRSAAVHTLRALVTDLETLLRHSTALEASGENRALDREAREIVAALLDVAPGEVSRRSDTFAGLELVTRARTAAARRALGEPLAYCVGSAAFRHLTLRVDRRVLIPRPETEIVVQEALKLAALRPGGLAIDIGTGSGAIALSLATEAAFERIVATDISADALTVAEHNYRALQVTHCPVTFLPGADFGPLGGMKARILVSNPPYISPDEASSLPGSVRDWEPAIALVAEQGGMACYDALLAGAHGHLEPDGWLVLEVDARRAQETARRARASGHYRDVRLVRDLAGRDRVLVARAGVDTPSD